MKLSINKYQLSILGLLGVIVALLAVQFAPAIPTAQADNTHVYTQYQNPQNDLFHTVANGKNITVEQISLFKDVLGLIQQYAEIAGDPTASAVSAVMSVEDHISNSSQAISFLENNLATSNNSKIKSAIRMKLLDLYSKSGQSDKAQSMLQQLINP